jgi:hypothetical protein
MPDRRSESAAVTVTATRPHLCTGTAAVADAAWAIIVNANAGSPAYLETREQGSARGCSPSIHAMKRFCAEVISAAFSISSWWQIGTKDIVWTAGVGPTVFKLL